MKKVALYLLFTLALPLSINAAGGSGMYQFSVSLTGYISPETNKAPNAYLWIPDNCKRVRAVMFAQQNMTEEMLYKMPSFQKRMKEMDIALLWVAPAFSYNWDPLTNCQEVYEVMMENLAKESKHSEINKVPIIPFGHSTHATFPWNFAAWNNDRTLCIISFHGDAPRTNLCGHGRANVEWGRTRNIDGIPGLMIEGEYEWWEARVRPALAFRMMYPESCVSFLCDAGSGHCEIMPETAEYIALFIQKAIEQRLGKNGQLLPLNPRNGWFACRYNPDSKPSDGDGAEDDIFSIAQRPSPAPYKDYKGDPHDAFWYFDKEMAQITESRYAETWGKQLVTIEKITPVVSTDGQTVTLDTPEDVHVEVVGGPLYKIDNRTFRFYPYECGMDNPRRSYKALLVAIREGNDRQKRAVLPIEVKLPKDLR